MFGREGVDLDRSTLADWVGKSTALLEPLADAGARHVLKGQAIFADDTPVKLLTPGSGKTRTARLWAYVRDERPWAGEAHPAAWYQFSPDRKGVRPNTHLANYTGWMHADGYAGFNDLYRTGRVSEVACMAHRGDRLCPTHATKRGRRYRYYISKRLMHGTGAAVAGWRLSAKELDGAVMQAVGDFLKDELCIIETLQLAGTAPGRLRGILHRAAALAEKLNDRRCQRRVLRGFLHRITLHTGSMHIQIQRLGLDTLLTGNSNPDTAQSDLIDVTVPITLRHRGVEAKLIIHAARDNAAAPDKNLIFLVARTCCWFDQLAAGETASIQEIAWCVGADASDIGRNLQLAFLAPDIVEAILAGRQPIELTAGRLRRIGTLPLEWHRQRHILGFPA